MRCVLFWLTCSRAFFSARAACDLADACWYLALHALRAIWLMRSRASCSACTARSLPDVLSCNRPNCTQRMQSKMNNNTSATWHAAHAKQDARKRINQSAHEEQDAREHISQIAHSTCRARCTEGHQPNNAAHEEQDAREHINQITPSA